MQPSHSSQNSAQSNIDKMRSTAEERIKATKSYTSTDAHMAVSPQSRPSSTMFSEIQRSTGRSSFITYAPSKIPTAVSNKAGDCEVSSTKTSGNKMSLSNLISDPEPVSLPPIDGGFSVQNIKSGYVPNFANNTIETNKGGMFFPTIRRKDYRMANYVGLSSTTTGKPGPGPSLLKFLSDNPRPMRTIGPQTTSTPGLSSRYSDVGVFGVRRLEGTRSSLGSSSQGGYSGDVAMKTSYRQESNKRNHEYESMQVSSRQYQPVPNEPKAKRPWTEQEDNLLRSLVDRLGQGLWAAIAAQIPGRSGKQVRERWLNHLSPTVTKRPWSVEEDKIILDSHRRMGNCWSRIAKLLQGRSDNSVKNRFYTTLRRRISNSNSMDRRGSQQYGLTNVQSKKKRKSPTVTQPSDQVEIVNRRCKQARVWE